MRFFVITGIILAIVLVVALMSFTSAVVSLGKLAFYGVLLIVLGAAAAFLWLKRRV